MRINFNGGRAAVAGVDDDDDDTSSASTLGAEAPKAEEPPTNI